jgi:hypothetical protein
MISSANIYLSKVAKVLRRRSLNRLMMLLLIAVSLLTANNSLAQNPFIPKYDAVKRSERCFTVTWEANNQFGAVW